MAWMVLLDQQDQSDLRDPRAALQDLQDQRVLRVHPVVLLAPLGQPVLLAPQVLKVQRVQLAFQGR